MGNGPTEVFQPGLYAHPEPRLRRPVQIPAGQIEQATLEEKTTPDPTQTTFSSLRDL